MCKHLYISTCNIKIWSIINRLQKNITCKPNDGIASPYINDRYQYYIDNNHLYLCYCNMIDEADSYR